MDIVKAGMCGTVESSDITIIIEPNLYKGISIRLRSSVENQFGDQIKSVIQKTLEELNVKDCSVSVTDKGALDCVIKARVQTAAYRAADRTDYKW